MHGSSQADTSYYAVLGVKKSATSADIRAAYLNLVRRHHPDKLQQLGRGSELVETAPLAIDTALNSKDLIHQVNQAYYTLSDDNLRSQYDKKLALSSSSALASRPRISATVDFEAFVPSEGSDVGISFSYACRCGSHYTVTEDQVHDLVGLIGCGGCSEVIQVRYDTLDN